MPETERMVCVRISCYCPRWGEEGDRPEYPKEIIGIHRISAADPRAKVGSYWTGDRDSCKGQWHDSRHCEDQGCVPRGKIVEVFETCEGCPVKDKCPLREDKTASAVSATQSVAV